MLGLKLLFLKSNFLFGGIPLSCESISPSNVRNYNRRIVNGELENISKGLWRSMNSFGIKIVSNNCDPISRIEELERKESKRGRGGKGLKIGCHDNSFIQCKRWG